jgi:hypothetical protein
VTVGVPRNGVIRLVDCCLLTKLVKQVVERIRIIGSLVDSAPQYRSHGTFHRFHAPPTTVIGL